ncbi:site-specific DNA-methyltransferase [Mycoplasma phocimorsus]|uniref:site-specific DNA-methyltransferase n=1 Tax=Mycoplasma phocimorsus TaxID=3045839 RepID=UPI00321F692D
MKWEEKHVNLLKDYKKKIDDIAVSDLNKDQKELSKMILDNLKDPLQLQNVFQFLMNRIKIGFTFDAAPEVNKKEIALLKFNKKLSFNNNENGAKNQLIIGENYDALKNLLVVQKEKYKEHAIANYDVIYIDPPYNTESAFSDGNCVADDKEKVNAKKFIYRDKFSRNGWLNMMNERLQLARKLLKEDGVIFVSIDDSEQAYLKVLMDEIFGEENFVANIIWQKKNSGSGADSKHLKILTEYILFYTKNKDKLVLNELQMELNNSNYKFEDKFVTTRGKYLTKQLDMASLTWSQGLDYVIEYEGKKYFAGSSEENYELRKSGKHAEKDWRWRWSKEKLQWGIENDFIVFQNGKVFSKQYQYVDNNNNPIKRTNKFTNIIFDIHGTKGTDEQKKYFY